MAVTYVAIADPTAGDEQRMFRMTDDSNGGPAEYPHAHLINWTPEWIFFMPEGVQFYTEQPFVSTMNATQFGITVQGTTGGGYTALLVVGRTPTRDGKA